MNHTVSLGILLSVLWLLLSGHSEPLMLFFGIVSVAFSLWVAKQFNLLDTESHPTHLGFKLIRFWLSLGFKIIQANIDVALIIMGIRKASPQMIKIPTPKNDDLAKVIYANSVTLTPGSASVHMENGDLLVHTLSEEGAKELFEGELAEMVPQTNHNVNSGS